LKTALPLFCVLFIFNVRISKQQQGSKICVSLGEEIWTIMTVAIQAEVSVLISVLIRDRTQCKGTPPLLFVD